MRSLASDLVPFAARLAGAPRIYADANLPQGIVRAMRETLGWDVLFVLEHDDLRRAPDREHFTRARDQGRTLITLDRDFLDTRRFPLDLSGGVVVCSAPGERELLLLLTRLDRELFRAARETDDGIAPLAGRTLDWHPGATLP
ncbi:MAG TPA: DUF5615 family PIN-like protein [Vicinamibacterales bacterium]|nr:DUF5615 family PIN-like protein [Vicinamibacterales bacterium]